MPTYEYKCSQNPEHKFSEIRGMTEEPTRSTCAEEGCGTKLVRVFTAPTITFNGTGFNASRG